MFRSASSRTTNLASLSRTSVNSLKKLWFINLTPGSSDSRSAASTATAWLSLANSRKPFSRSEEHTSELQSLMRISYAVFCLKKKKNNIKQYKYVHKQRT